MPPPAPLPAFCLVPIASASPRRALAATAAALSLTLLPLLPLARPAAAHAASVHAAAAAASLPARPLFDRDFLRTFRPPPPPAPAAAPRAPLALPPRPSLTAELRILTRLLVALVVGGCIGMERRAANSLAGVRTFSLVSLGAAIFMITVLVAFPQADPARIAAAISSSVGFLGAGAMHKNARHHRGLTTASSVWLAAALGIAAASGMFLLSFAGAVSTVLIARYARFDSSLQLIRDDPGGNALRDEPDGLPPRTRTRGPTGSRPAEARGAGAMQGGMAAAAKAPWRDRVQLQALVDYDPSSRGGGEEERERGQDGGGDEGRTR